MDTRAPHHPATGRAERIVAWVLAVSYWVGVPIAVAMEYRTGFMSARFGFPPAFVYAVSAAQFVLAAGLLVPRFLVASGVALTVITLGAVASHLRIGSPLTALPALAYTLVQLWLIFRARRPGH